MAQKMPIYFLQLLRLATSCVVRDAFRKINGIKWEFFPNSGGGGGVTQTHLIMFVHQVFFASQNHPEVPKHVLQKWSGDI